ncbi:hypothetical protein DYB28_001584 [Aphanomyces astaci]|uniref:Uncharacterized protein n=1 Tax=Aphanomyces astaci TaxID=112090 RepID=A0A397CHK5_APHAT|nr:hypothetical protein DYB30_014285 [Aphanomyces astaci]RHY98649.1 hypothetical protein DYB35_013968 [Aphanomyces astaci]RLO07141.1 hypothetical protein DYB28_001584 [Aphanomyces astaci]
MQSSKVADMALFTCATHKHRTQCVVLGSCHFPHSRHHQLADQRLPPEQSGCVSSTAASSKPPPNKSASVTAAASCAKSTTVPSTPGPTAFAIGIVHFDIDIPDDKDEYLSLDQLLGELTILDVE